MTAPFVTQLRTRGDAIRLGAPSGPSLTVRVEMPEVWDTVRVVVSPTTLVKELKGASLAAMYPHAETASAFVLKLRGFEVLDENATVAQSGAIDGSCYLLTHRYRRPVR